MKQYNSGLRQWYLFCSVNEEFEYFNPTRFSPLKFLKSKFDEGSTYGTLNTYRSAISLLSPNKIGEDVMVCKFLKGIYKLKPTEPKYTFTWDISLVLSYLKSIDLNSPNVSFKQITDKTVMLIASSSSQSTNNYTYRHI